MTLAKELVKTPVTPEQMQALIGRLPRVPCAYKNTPLEECPRFAAALGTTANIFVKRDDLTGPALPPGAGRPPPPPPAAGQPADRPDPRRRDPLRPRRAGPAAHDGRD